MSGDRRSTPRRFVARVEPTGNATGPASRCDCDTSECCDCRSTPRARVRHIGAARQDDLLAGVPDVVRLRMELLARSSTSPELALEPVLALLVDDDEARLAAIATAFRTNPPLREQWERTWHVLRT